jgi:uncharacterized membrane protein YhiD involved in acid resistance
MALPLDPAWIALIGTVVATVGLKVTEHWLNRNKNQSDDAKQIRDELRIQVVTQKEEIERLETDLEAWRTKYYDLRDSFMKQNTELTLALEKLKATAKSLDEQLPQ